MVLRTAGTSHRPQQQQRQQQPEWITLPWMLTWLQLPTLTATWTHTRPTRPPSTTGYPRVIRRRVTTRTLLLHTRITHTNSHTTYRPFMGQSHLSTSHTTAPKR